MKKLVVIVLIFLFLTSYISVLAQNETNQTKPEAVVVEAKPAAVAGPILLLVQRAISAIKPRVDWIITRDYLSAGRNLFKWFWGLSLAIKIIALLLFLILLVVVWNYTLRNSRVNNLRRARKHHLKGEKAHMKGDEEKARYHYEKAQKYRERAQEQW